MSSTGGAGSVEVTAGRQARAPEPRPGRRPLHEWHGGRRRVLGQHPPGRPDAGVHRLRHDGHRRHPRRGGDGALGQGVADDRPGRARPVGDEDHVRRRSPRSQSAVAQAVAMRRSPARSSSNVITADDARLDRRRAHWINQLTTPPGRARRRRSTLSARGRHEADRTSPERSPLTDRGSAGIAVSIIVEVIDKDVGAWIGKSAHVSAGGDISVSATSKEDLFELTVAGGASEGAAVTGAITVIVLNEAGTHGTAASSTTTRSSSPAARSRSARATRPTGSTSPPATLRLAAAARASAHRRSSSSATARSTRPSTRAPSVSGNGAPGLGVSAAQLVNGNYIAVGGAAAMRPESQAPSSST